MTDCIFCKIAAGEIPSTKVYEDDDVVAFNDIEPKAPVHVLVIPKRHFDSMNDLPVEDADLLGHLFSAIKQVAQAKNISDTGYRVITNIGKDSGQIVKHIHFHVMGGRTLGDLG